MIAIMSITGSAQYYCVDRPFLHCYSKLHQAPWIDYL